VRNRRATTPLELAAQRAMRRFLDLPHDTRHSVAAVVDILGQCFGKPGALREACDYLVSARRMLATKPAAGSPILRKRSLGSRFDGFEIALAELKTASKAIGATVNDVFLAGLIGGFRRYHEQMGVKLATMPIGFPISLRTAGDAAGGNKFAGAQYAAPIGERDPMKRIEHIQSFVRSARSEPALGVVLKIAPVMVRLPTPLLTSIAAKMTAAQDAQVSNIPGIARPMFMAGAEVTHYWPFAPTAGCGMMIAMVSHNGRCCVGINSDRAAVTQPELLADCLREGLEEMLALRAPAPPRTMAPVGEVRKPRARSPKKPAVKVAARSVGSRTRRS
jgi:hypothetical protein